MVVTIVRFKVYYPFKKEKKKTFLLFFFVLFCLLRLLLIHQDTNHKREIFKT